MSSPVSNSISNSISKYSIDEEIEVKQESISNEKIVNGTELLGMYKVTSDAIRGGMGSVWRVHHKDWNVDLAMKRPLPRFFAEGSEKRKENFIRECESWINLGMHPNIVSCYYVREIGGVPTIFSEWMENGSLENRIRDGSLYQGTEEEKQARLLDIAIQFSRGLHYAHENGGGMIHQDVKPANLLLTNEYEAKVADFGLARARVQIMEESLPESKNTEQLTYDKKAGSTQLVATSGYTPAYCSNEQLLGEKLTRRTDIYSWALSVLEMYLGKRSWKNGAEAGQNCGLYFSQCREPMPEALCRLLEKCLKRDPDERPHDFGLIEAELIEIYKVTTGYRYLRPEPEAAADTADSLNNHALSYLDLGKKDEADRCWKESMARDAGDINCIYNYALYQWRSGKIHMGVAMEHIDRITDRDKRDALKRALRAESKGTLILRTDQEAAYLSSPEGPLYSNDGRRILRGIKLIDRRTGELITECSFSGNGWDELEKEIAYRTFLNDGSYILVIYGIKRYSEKYYLGWIWDAETGQSLFRYELQESDYKREGDAFYLYADPAVMRVEAGPRASYSLSTIRSTAIRLEDQKKYTEFIFRAEQALQDGREKEALLFADQASAVPGFQSDPEPVRIRAAAGEQLHKSGVRRILQEKTTPEVVLGKTTPEVVFSARQRKTTPEVVLPPEEYEEDLEIAGEYVNRHLFPDTNMIEYWVRALPVELSGDNRYLLVDLSVEETERGRPTYNGFDGALVMELETRKVEACDRQMFSKRYGPRQSKYSRILHINKDGSFFLVANERVLVVFNVEKQRIQSVLFNGPYIYAGFVRDDPFVFCAGKDVDQRGENHYLNIIDLSDGAVLYEGSYEDAFAESIHFTEDNSFVIENSDRALMNCLIDWQYSEESANNRCRIEVTEINTSYGKRNPDDDSGFHGIPIINRVCKPSDLSICQKRLRTEEKNAASAKVFRANRNELYGLFIELNWDWTLEPWGLRIIDRNRDYQVVFHEE